MDEALRLVLKIEYILKMKIFEGEVGFYYSCGFNSSSENILLCWYVARLRYSV